MVNLPTITDDERARLESKLVASGLSKINSGLSPTKQEMAAIDAAHARSKATPTAPAALLFFPENQTQLTELGFEVVVTKTLESRGIYDLTRLDANKPEIAKAAVKMLAKGLGVDEIADCLSLDVRTVAALRDRAEETGAMPGHKEMTVRGLKSLVGMMISKYREKIAAGEFTAVEMAVLIDKIELLSGGVTSRTETVVTTDEATEDFSRLVRDMRARMVTSGLEIPPKAGFPPSLPPLPPPSAPLVIHEITRDK